MRSLPTLPRLASGIAVVALALAAEPACAVLKAGDFIVSDHSALTFGVIFGVDRVTGAQTIISSGGSFNANAILGVAQDANGDILVAQQLDALAPAGVVRVNPLTGAQTVVSSGGSLFSTSGLALEASGDILVVDPLDAGPSAIVVRINPLTGVQTTVSSDGNFVRPFGIAVNSIGEIYVAEAGTAQADGSVIGVNPVTGVQTTICSGGNFRDPLGIAVAPNGDLIVGDRGEMLVPDGAIIRCDAATGVQTIVSSGGNLVDPVGVAVEANGDIVVADSDAFGGSGGIIRINPVTGVQTTLSSGGSFVGPIFLAIVSHVCGNGFAEAGEQCDDGNASSGDGCSSTCQCESTCGNGTVEGPCEQCDLGSDDNCAPASCCSSGCTSDCRVTGLCAGSQACCTGSTDCPTGEGCCGNDIVEANEQCDDGNVEDGDCCSSTCQVEASPCAPLPGVCAGVFGPHLISNPSVRRTALRDTPLPPLFARDGVLDRWAAQGQFSLHDGQRIDPDTETVAYVLSQNDGTAQSTELYHPVLDPVQCTGGVCFMAKTNAQGVDQSWTFRLKTGVPDVGGAPGWQKGKFTRDRVIANRIKFNLSGKVGTVGTPQLVGATSIRRVRQSIKIGDDCITRPLDCAPNGARTQFTCREVHCGNGTVDRAEQCGEPGLPVCSGGKACDTCRCVMP